MAITTSDKTKDKAKDALLEMAKVWEKEGKLQHAIEAYERVIGIDVRNKEYEIETYCSLFKSLLAYSEKGAGFRQGSIL